MHLRTLLYREEIEKTPLGVNREEVYGFEIGVTQGLCVLRRGKCKER